MKNLSFCSNVCERIHVMCRDQCIWMWRKEAKQTVAKCKGYQKAKKGGKDVEEFSDKMKELKEFWVC